MSGLFLFSFADLSNILNSEMVFLICFIIVFVLTVLCTVISLNKKNYSFKNRLWIIFCFIGILLIDFWAEHFIIGQIKHIILIIGFEFISLSICLFVRKKQTIISDEKKSLANFLSRCAQNQNLIQSKEKEGEEQSCEVIKVKPNIEPSIKDEIDFSHVKTVLKKLDYYPLKEQDKKSAKELESAIIEAEENGLDQRLKQNINDGLGVLLKIMSKYAV